MPDIRTCNPRCLLDANRISEIEEDIDIAHRQDELPGDAAARIEIGLHVPVKRVGGRRYVAFDFHRASISQRRRSPRMKAAMTVSATSASALILAFTAPERPPIRRKPSLAQSERTAVHDRRTPDRLSCLSGFSRRE